MRVKRELPSIRVLGVDPAAAGPTGYGIIEGDGRQCRMLHYGALCPPEKRRRESAGGTLRAVHELLGRLIVEYEPDAMAVESVFAALNLNTASRLESNATGGQILVSEVTATAAQSRYELTPREPISVKNREQPVPLFEVEWQKATGA